MSCSGCAYDYYEQDCNFKDCLHPDFNEERPDSCPGKVSIEDWKVRFKGEG